jgi:hypothetical protein
LAATLLAGPGVGICVLGLLVVASDEAAGASLLPQPHDFIGFQAQLLPPLPQPPILQPVVISAEPSTRQVANFIPPKCDLRMGGESFLGPPAARSA